MPRPVALLDANVLYPARLRDLLIRLAIAGLCEARWSDQILDECFENVLTDRPDLTIEQLARTRRLMEIALPDAAVDEYEPFVESLDLPDPSDRHVLAAAVAAGTDLIVTANVRDFPPGKVHPDIRVASPDEFVLMLLEHDLDVVVDVIEAQAAALKNPPMTPEQLLGGLEQVGLVRFVAVLRGALR